MTYAEGLALNDATPIPFASAIFNEKYCLLLNHEKVIPSFASYLSIPFEAGYGYTGRIKVRNFFIENSVFRGGLHGEYPPKKRRFII